MRALPEIGEGRGLRDVVECEQGGLLERILRVCGERILNSLGFKRAHNAEADCAANCASQLTKQKQAHARMSIHAETTQEGAENRCKMAAGACDSNVERSFGGGEEGSALEATRAVRDVVGGEHVEGGIELGKTVRLKVRLGHKGQRAVTALSDLTPQENVQIGARADFAMLPGGFEPARMRKAAGWKRRVSDLPDEPGILRLSRIGRLLCDSRRCFKRDHVRKGSSVAPAAVRGRDRT